MKKKVMGNSTPALGFPRNISVMGSTGSIGTQTLDIVRHYPEKFKVVALTAGSNWELLASQALEFRPRLAVIADSRYLSPLVDALKGSGVEVSSGDDELNRAATLPETDIVVGALVGYSGLPSTVAALEAGKKVALANKETLVVAGELIERIVARKGNPILPVDSEHSAIFQCLFGEDPEKVSKIILTASGGPFRRFTADQLAHVTVDQALKHPNWAMGNKVTIDSATMMNKGFEMIEARWLFSKNPDDIEVVVHPESIIHSMIEMTDGSVKAQMSLPDMRLPIEVAISYPERIDLQKRLGTRKLSFSEIRNLTFEQPDFVRFPLLELAYEAAHRGGLAPALLNAANEVAVRAFLNSKIRFTDIFTIVDRTLARGSSEVDGIDVTLENISAAHHLGTDIAKQILDSF